MSEHVHGIIKSCSQTFHALMNDLTHLRFRLTHQPSTSRPSGRYSKASIEEEEEEDDDDDDDEDLLTLAAV